MENFTVKIEQDIDPINPRTNFQFGTFVAFHSRYRLGDPDHGYRVSDYSGWDALENAIYQDHDIAACIPVYMHDHSEIKLRAGMPFSCPWDSGQVGFIFVTKDQACTYMGYKSEPKNITPDRAEQLEEHLKAEIELYNQYITGDVWGYTIENAQGEEVAACWGFFGRDACEQAAQLEKEALEKKYENNFIAANI